jgi:hypothetical protein
MNTTVLSSSALSRPTTWLRGLMFTALVAGAWSLSTATAQARDDVYWSIGVQSPGVAVGVSNAPPAPVVVHQAYPVYQPRPVYQRPVVVHQAPVIVYPAPVYSYVRPVVVTQDRFERPGRGHGPRWDDRGHPGWHKGQHKNGHKNDHKRHDRHERSGGGHGGWHDHRR